MTVEHSFVVPIHNGSEFIHLFWHSLLPNLLPDSELVIVDDGSREDIRQLVPTFPADVTSRLFRNEKLSATMMKGLILFPGLLPGIIRRTHGKPLKAAVECV